MGLGVFTCCADCEQNILLQAPVLALQGTLQQTLWLHEHNKTQHRGAGCAHTARGATALGMLQRAHDKVTIESPNLVPLCSLARAGA